LKPAEAKFIKLDLKINNQKIGYIMGAGDVPEVLLRWAISNTIKS
jgi:hypothetical protein